MITQKELKELVHYSTETGVFTRAKNWYNKPKGSVLGHKHDQGYLHLTIKSKQYYLHRLAFLYVEGYLPEYTVDHINGVRDDNRWKNLRHASVSCQRQNTAMLSTNTSGYKGVSFNQSSGKWGAQVIVNGKHHWLGSYDCPLEAALVRVVFEDWCPEWNCDARSWNREKVMDDLNKAIREQDTSSWTYSEELSSRNTSGYKGVKKDKRAKNTPYRAQVSYKGKRYHIGSFSSAGEAATARDSFILEKGWPITLQVLTK